MGCFLSTTKRTPPNANTKVQTTTTHRSPPSTLPFLEQEEEVKEILSETPIIINNNNPITNTTDEKINIPKKNVSHNIHDSHVFKIAKIFNPRELTGSIRVGSDPKELGKSIRVGSGQNEATKELSEHIQVGSGRKEMKEELSKSIRVRSDPKETTKDLSRHIRVGSGQKEMMEELSRSIRVGSDPIGTTIKDIRQKSPAKHRNTSPARRSDHLSGSGQTQNTSPARKPDHQFGSGQTRNISPGRVGSGSCRGSRSPVMCGDQINGGTKNSISRCPSMRKSGKSPGRVRSELGDRRRSPAPETGNGSRSNRENNYYKRNLTSGINESIENPHVSLECFIFI